MLSQLLSSLAHLILVHVQEALLLHLSGSGSLAVSKQAPQVGL
jgi:hypothetical protein